jgi:1-acyl-sn-glycerol-3-phosphate acyltransferase
MEKTADNNIGDRKFIDIEKVFASKNPGLLKVIPNFIINYLKRITHEDEINNFLDKTKNISGIEFVNATLSDLIPTEVLQNGLDNIPENGRYLFVSNHPLGGIDGLAFIKAVAIKFPNIKFPVNDILLNLDGLKPFFIPINKHGSNNREAAQIFDETFQSDCQVLYFPAGMVSRKVKGKIVDLEWKKSFLKKAIASKRDIVPVHISGRNSKFFYNLSKARQLFGIKANIEMLYLADETFNFNGKKIVINFGTPIQYHRLKTELSANEWITKIRESVYQLAIE